VGGLVDGLPSGTRPGQVVQMHYPAPSGAALPVTFQNHLISPVAHRGHQTQAVLHEAFEQSSATDVGDLVGGPRLPERDDGRACDGVDPQVFDGVAASGVEREKHQVSCVDVVIMAPHGAPWGE